ncbi:MAG: hypothetical protein ABH986_05155 [archaeon]
MASWSIFEFREVLKNILFEIQLTRLGYSVREFTEAKRSVELPEDIRKQVIGVTTELSNRVKEVEKIEFNKERIKELDNLNEKGMELVDAILFLSSHELDCNYFVTRDSHIKICLERTKFKTKTKVVHPKEFIRIMTRVK